MDHEERRDLVDELIDALERRGVPEGSWLFDVMKARRALAEVDDLLRRLERAILDAGGGPPAALILALVLA